MSRATIGGLSDEQVDAVATGSNVQVTIGSLPNEVRLMLPRARAERLHAALGEALAQDGGASDACRDAPHPAHSRDHRIHVIEGKPSASAGLMSAVVRRAGHRLRITGDDRKAVCEIVRSDDPDCVFQSEWTLDRARTAELLGKANWKKQPAAMLKACAISGAPATPAKRR
jgi:hypothetical protein